jgi:hypothetical protein
VYFNNDTTGNAVRNALDLIERVRPADRATVQRNPKRPS